jgi:calcineurin-like phosphoesterase family protein
MSKINILHLSDIHFKRSEKDTDPTMRGDVMEKMLAALRQHLDKHRVVPDFTAVTGDIAFAGKENQYRDARLFFKELKTLFPNTEFLLVPGNHDVDRDQVDTCFPLYDTIIQKEKIDAFLNNKTHIQGFIKPKFDTYKAFVKDINPGLYSAPDDGLSSPVTDAAGYFWVKNIPGKKVSFLGLNSCWSSEKDNEAMKIALGFPQVIKALGLATQENKIVLLHHPLFDWLDEKDNSRCRGEIFNRCALVLHGHRHVDDQLVLKSPSGSCICLGANASYTKDKDGYIGFQWIEVRFRGRGVGGGNVVDLKEEEINKSFLGVQGAIFQKSPLVRQDFNCSFIASGGPAGSQTFTDAFQPFSKKANSCFNPDGFNDSEAPSLMGWGCQPPFEKV